MPAHRTRRSSLARLITFGACGLLLVVAGVDCSSEGSSAGAGAAGSGANNSGGANGNCTAATEACGHPDECCSSFCLDGACINPGDCSLPEEACTAPSDCCTGRCEPETGTGEVKCLNFCFDDGQACEKALDCCDLGCWNGVCDSGPGPCFIQSSDCNADSDCCSNICLDGECDIDETNTDCRPTRETCNSGSGSGCCHVCDDTQDPPICVYGDDICKPTGGICVDDADCCKGQCLDDGTGVLRCDPACIDTGLPCTFSAECCETNCQDGTCLPPEDPCVPTGDACMTNADCCGGLCLGGVCDVPCELTGSGCTSPADCCSGICIGSLCASIN